MKTKILFIGFGKMGKALYKGLSDSNSKEWEFTLGVANSLKARNLQKQLGVKCTPDWLAEIQWAHIVLICLKPTNARVLLHKSATFFNKDQIAISICAGISTRELRKLLGKKCSIVRAMPNTPCLISKGTTLLCLEKLSDPRALKKAQFIFNKLGTTHVLAENKFDAATSISACGPAYVFSFLEAQATAGCKLGIPYPLALQLAAQTTLGATQMLKDRNENPKALIKEVATPGGMTIEGLEVLKKENFNKIIFNCFEAATKKSKSLK